MYDERLNDKMNNDTQEVTASVVKRFVMPIMLEQGKKWDKTIPFEWLDEAQAQKNHGQTLKRLAERGGLDPGEAIALLNCDPWKPITNKIGLEILSRWLMERRHNAKFTGTAE